MMLDNLKLSNHSGIIIAIVVLALLEFEGVAEISKPFEFWDIFQFAVIDLKINNTHIQVVCNNQRGAYVLFEIHRPR